MKKKNKIIITRNSVCLADDIYAPHEKKWNLDLKSSIHKILQQCKSEYLPTNLQGGTPRWIAKCDNNVIAVVAQSCKESTIIKRKQTLESLINSDGNLELRFELLPENEFKSVIKNITEKT